jgi:hypothetical protein
MNSGGPDKGQTLNLSTGEIAANTLKGIETAAERAPPMSNIAASRAPSADGPATRGFAITPDDVADISGPTRALYVGTSGDIALVLVSGDEIVLEGVAGGTLLPLRVKQVSASGTTAGGLVGLE